MICVVIPVDPAWAYARRKPAVVYVNNDNNTSLALHGSNVGDGARIVNLAGVNSG